MTSTKALEDIKYLRESRIEFAYLIPGLISIGLTLILYVYPVRGTRERKEEKEHAVKNTNRNTSRSFKQMTNPATCAGGSVIHGLQMFFWLFLFYFNCVGGEKLA